MNVPVILRAAPGSEHAAIRDVCAALRRGLLAVVPTDTVYGLVADPSFPEAVERIYAAKSRDARKPIPLLVASVSDAERFGARFGPEERALVSRFWPGPLTLLMDCESHDRFGRPVTTTEGFRMPKHDLMLSLLGEAGGVLRATSANISGEPPALTVEEAVAALGPSVAVAVDGGAAKIGVPSTVARIHRDAGGKRLQVMRQGAIERGSLEEVLKAIDRN